MPRVPERPESLADLDLMKRLKRLSEGDATWHADGHSLGLHEREVCGLLHSNLVGLIDRCVSPLLDRIAAREMQTFTMHDRNHGLKVAHLMWQIIKPSRRELLTPAEIAFLIVAAYFHDLGMALSDEERHARLQQGSDLWDRLDPQSVYFDSIEKLKLLASKDAREEAVAEAIYQIQQAQEALLCIDVRERHATRQRYEEIVRSLQAMHETDPVNIPDIHSALSFDRDSYENKLIDVCVSHNQEAYALLDHDPSNVDQWRFPIEYPVGCCTADTRLVASALRLADILDFDRERTPAVLFHYLLPRSGSPVDNVSIREWAKHLAISSWEIQDGKLIFRARSPTALIHHTIVQFCRAIEDEIAKTASAFGDEEWPFSIQPQVHAAIEASGYRYVPYKFSLDEERIYELVLGEKIYRNRLDAVRELVQNAVDACKLRDALMRCHDTSALPSNIRRIIIRYEEPTAERDSPTISITDTGVGMNRYIIENFFLKLGQSYYRSSDFLQTRALLRKQNLDFKPISEFGIGFASVFMLGDRVEVETASWIGDRNDKRKRVMRIDGLGRLIEVYEDPNTALPHFHGTKITIHLAKRASREPPLWDEIVSYLRRTCVNLPYSIVLEHVTQVQIVESAIDPQGLQIQIPEHLRNTTMTIPVHDHQNGLDGEIVIFHEREGAAAERRLTDEIAIRSAEQEDQLGPQTALLRGGFYVRAVPGLPEFILSPSAIARIEVSKDRTHANLLPATNLARTTLAQETDIASAVFRLWLEALLQKLPKIEKHPIGSPNVDSKLILSADWLERYSALDLYKLAKSCWVSAWRNTTGARDAIKNWEMGLGKPIQVARTYSRSLYWNIFELILPNFTELQIDEDRYYFSPLRKGWRTELKGNHNFIKTPSGWGHFASYVGRKAPFLWAAASGHRFLNKKYQQRFSDFAVAERSRLRDLLSDLSANKSAGRQTRLSNSDIDLVKRIIAVAGSLTIERFGEEYKVADLYGRIYSKRRRR
jgi:Histidine kinase-, DNA gyrase B-, and HSP90-like ATPase